MTITKEFLESELRSLDLEIRKAQTFLIQAQAVTDAYRMLLVKLDEPEYNEKVTGDERNDGSPGPRGEGSDQ